MLYVVVCGMGDEEFIKQLAGIKTILANAEPDVVYIGSDQIFELSCFDSKTEQTYTGGEALRMILFAKGDMQQVDDEKSAKQS